MAYADNPARLARLLRDLADALEKAGVNPSGSSSDRHLMDDARKAARELDPPQEGGRSGRFHAF
ncbi:hypothetical protein [Streptomyces sp. NPDC096153]|uniref:hypothetical protein n=1 Tax=Streptomyces sp. NPDC096153 TaxID=3155548 RepID=UPI003325976D